MIKLNGQRSTTLKRKVGLEKLTLTEPIERNSGIGKQRLIKLLQIYGRTWREKNSIKSNIANIYKE